MVSTDALASFEDKWSLAHPELLLSLRFVQPEARAVVSALSCLGFEVGLAAYSVTEAGVAASKLHWWAEELALLPAAKARHPLTQVLAASNALRALPAESWQVWIASAFAQREAAPARSLAELIAGYRLFQEPLAQIQSVLYPDLSVDSEAQAGGMSRVVQHSMHLAESLTAERLPLPLDLLARHGISRSELAVADPRRDVLLREHFAALADAIAALDRRGLTPFTAAGLAAHLQRCRGAAKAVNPLESMSGKLDRLPFPALWACWRAARRVQPRP